MTKIAPTSPTSTRLRRLSSRVLPAVALALLMLTSTGANAEDWTNVHVDFDQTTTHGSPLAQSLDESTTGYGSALDVDAVEQQRIRHLGASLLRIPLQVVDGVVTCEAAGCDHSITADTWAGAIRSSGAEPEIEVPLDVAQATTIVRHFNGTPTKQRVDRWIVSNEPDGHGVSVEDYSAAFNRVVDAMKAVDSSINVGGPATAWFNTDYLREFLIRCGPRVNFVDFHQYAEGGPVTRVPAELMQRTVEWEDNVRQLRRIILDTVPSRASSIDIEVGEWNLSWSGDDPLAYQTFTTVWSASVLGHILQAGAISRVYATKGGALGVLFETDDLARQARRDDPMPIYHGLAMFSGESLFPAFGPDLVNASTSLSDVEVYAAAAPRMLVVINKNPSESRTARLQLTGYDHGVGQVWMNAQQPFAPPTNTGQLTISGGKTTLLLPPYSVASIVLSPQNKWTASLRGTRRH